MPTFPRRTRELRWLLLAVVSSAACGDPTGVDGGLLEYRAPIAGTFAEVFTYTGNNGPPQCTVYSTLSGTVRIKLQKQGDLEGADAGVDLTERVVGAGPPNIGCNSSREVRPYGEWTDTITGTPSQLGFTMSKTSLGVTTTIQFAGALIGDTVAGTLKYKRTAASLSGGTAGSSAGETTFLIKLLISSATPAALTGTWTGTLALTLDGAPSTRTSTLALTQNGTSVTGQLQFDGGEVDVVEGTVSGSTLALTLTPRPAGDSCELYSFGITFTIDPDGLRARGGTGTACEAGGKTLRTISAASGLLVR
jgi:hypothetical protein